MAVKWPKIFKDACDSKWHLIPTQPNQRTNLPEHKLVYDCKCEAVFARYFGQNLLLAAGALSGELIDGAVSVPVPEGSSQGLHPKFTLAAREAMKEELDVAEYDAAMAYCSVLSSVKLAINTSQFAYGLSFSRTVQLSHVCDSLPSQVRQSDNQCRQFCAVLLGPPEEIALCTLSTHYALAAASFNPGTCTLLPRNAYVLTELFLHRIVFFCCTHLTHRCSMLINCGFESYLILYPTMQLPSTS